MAVRAGAGWEFGERERNDLRLTWLTQDGQKARALTVRLLREWRSSGLRSATTACLSRVFTVDITADPGIF